MKIVAREPDRILFAAQTLDVRIGGGFIAGSFFVFGLVFIAIALRALLAVFGVTEDVDDPKVIASFSLLLGSAFVYIGSQAWFVALPFQFVITREPLTTRFVWRSWQVKHKRFAEHLGLIAELSTRPRSIVFVLSVRTSAGEALLLTSNETWSVEADARVAAKVLGEELATFLGCPLETRWKVD